MTSTSEKKKPSDWLRIKQEAASEAPIAHRGSDGPYDPNDEAATSAYWKEATIRRGPGRPALAVKRPTLNMRVDAEILAAFKATGPGWQTRINALLKDAVRRGVVKT